MGSGYFMNAYVLSLARDQDDLDTMDLRDPGDYIRTRTELDDYETSSKGAAARVAEVARQLNPDYQSIKVVKSGVRYKVAFFK